MVSSSHRIALALAGTIREGVQRKELDKRAKNLLPIFGHPSWCLLFTGLLLLLLVPSGKESSERSLAKERKNCFLFFGHFFLFSGGDEAAPRPSLLGGVRQFIWNHLESVNCHFAEQLQPLSTNAQ